MWCPIEHVCQDVNVKRVELGLDVVVNKRNYLVRGHVACIIFVRVLLALLLLGNNQSQPQLHIGRSAAKVSVYLTYCVVVGNIASDSA